MIELNENLIDRNTPVPLYHQIATYFKGLIESGELAPGDKLPTEAELMKALKISPITVRQALGSLVKLGMIYRERGRGTFVRPGAQLNANGGNGHGRVAVVMPWASGTFFAPMVEAVEHALHLGGLHTMLVNNADDAQVEMRKLREVIDHGVDGMVWVIPTKGPNTALFNQIVKSDLPLVLVDRRIGDADVDFVGSDNVGGMKAIVSHVIETGRKRIALVREPVGASTAMDRQQGYEEALTEAGIEPDSSLIFTSREAFLENGRRCARRILSLGKSVDAICCTSEQAAMGVLAELRRARISIPDDIALTAFDDDGLAATAVPPLTTTRQDLLGMGATAAEVLIQRIANPDRPVETRHLPTTLTIRASTVGSQQYVGSKTPDPTK